METFHDLDVYEFDLNISSTVTVSTIAQAFNSYRVASGGAETSRWSRTGGRSSIPRYAAALD